MIPRRAVLPCRTETPRPADAVVLARSLYASMQADPVLLKDQSILRAFEATPWLLPQGTQLPYAGAQGDLDALLRVRAGPVGNSSLRGISLVLFSRPFWRLVQNHVWTLVVHAGTLRWEDPQGWQ